MSHSEAKAYFKDGTTFYFEYNGTSDIACNSLKETIEEVRRDWRTDGAYTNCQCRCESEDVEFFASYGNGIYWHGEACRKCMIITKGLDPYGIESPCYEEGFGFIV
jgi:hypothetical protein